MILNIKLLVALTLLGISTASAQMEKIDTDRPDQTESPAVIPKKWIQLEMGLSVQQNNKTEKEFLLPTLLSKYGISKKVEFRLITTLNCFSTTGNSNYTTGLEPVEVGTKIALTEEKKWIPKTSLLFHVVIPGLASKSLRADKLAPNFRFSMQHTLSGTVGLGYNLGAEWDGFSNKAIWAYTFAPGFNLGEKWYSYIEAFGFIAKDEPAQHNIDCGVAYYINDNTKVDISSGFGISKTAPDWYFTIGASIRFKKGN